MTYAVDNDDIVLRFFIHFQYLANYTKLSLSITHLQIKQARKLQATLPSPKLCPLTHLLTYLLTHGGEV